MNRYANGKIYMIESASAGLVYYGSSCDQLSKRLSKHIYTFKHSEKKNKASEIFIYPDYKIVLVENFPCNTKEELLAREAYYIRNNPCVNKKIPNRTIQEWRQDNKEKLNIDQEKWRKEHREQDLLRKKVFWDNNKDEINARRREKRLLKKSLQNIAPVVE